MGRKTHRFGLLESHAGSPCASRYPYKRKRSLVPLDPPGYVRNIHITQDVRFLYRHQQEARARPAFASCRHPCLRCPSAKKLGQVQAHAITSRRSASSSFFTKRPLTRMRVSAKFLRTSYLTIFVHTCF
ncbi:unnamed protein product [Ectocarpus sp. 12 AP-2014]